MALATDKIAETFLDIVASTPIDCDWPLYSETEVVVIYGQAALEAVYPSDYTVDLSPPNYDQFTITPTAALLTKINNLIAASPTTEINYITVRRVIGNLTSVTPETVRGVAYLSREVERLWMGIQQVAENVGRSLSYSRKEIAGDAAGELPSITLRANKAMVFDADGNVTVSEDDYNDQAADAAASAAAALANKLLTDANVVTTAADVVTTGVNAVAAADSAAVAQAAANGMKFRTARCATTANDSLSGLAARDGVTPIAGDRVLVKNHATPASCGLYIAAAGAWARASDMDTWAEVPGTIVIVQEGTTLADTAWICTSNDGGTLGVTAITFADWSSTIIAGAIALTKLANPATNTMLGNYTGATNPVTALSITANTFPARSSAGNTAAKPITDFGLSLVNSADAAAARSTMGVTVPLFTQTVDINYGILTNAAQSQAHGLPGIPKMMYAFLRCTTTDLGYSVGMEVPIQADAGNNRAINHSADATNVRAAFGPTTYQMNSYTSGGGYGPINGSNWILVVRCYY